MSNRANLPRHGFNHGKHGSDPTPGIGDGIQFNEDNETFPARWLRVEGNDGGPDPGDATSPSIQFVDADNRGILWDSDHAVNVNTIQNGDFNVGAPGTGGAINLTLNVGQSFTLFDHLGNPILRMTEGSPDLHIPTGGSVVADL